MPSSVKDRLTTTTERVFHFVKSPKYYYDLDAIRQPHQSSPQHLKNSRKGKSKFDDNVFFGSPRGHSWRSTDGHPLGKNPGDVFQSDREPYLKNNPHVMRKKSQEYLALDPSKPSDLSHPMGKNPGDVIKIGMHHGSSLTKGRATHYKGQKIESCLSGSNPGDFWAINTKPFKGAHFAVFPDTLIEPIIKSSCQKNGVVLDPMCGSGTTLIVAKRLGRNYLGCDINPNYVEMTKKRLAETEWPLDISNFKT